MKQRIRDARYLVLLHLDNWFHARHRCSDLNDPGRVGPLVCDLFDAVACGRRYRDVRRERKNPPPLTPLPVRTPPGGSAVVIDEDWPTIGPRDEMEISHLVERAVSMYPWDAP